jgi:manganese/iron transport system substrate-binding protein
MNPKYAMSYAKLTYNALVELDPAGKDYYDKNLSSFTTKVQALYDGIKVAAQTVPADQRRLLTYHDSWAYWAREFNWEVLGAIQPSDFKEPSAKEVGDLIDQIKKLKVKAIFGSEVFPSPTLEQIAKETGAKFIDKLRDDEPPGEAGTPEHTYVGMLLEDMKIMFEALGGNVDALKAITPDDTYIK